MVQKSNSIKLTGTESLFESFSIPDFTFTIGLMFLESFLAGNTKLTAKERSTISQTVVIVKNFFLKKKKL